MAESREGGEAETRRDRRILRQRQDIMDAAASLFASNGYAASTTKDIAQAADIGESTLYSYFPGKREILLAILDEQARQIDKILEPITTLSEYPSYVRLLENLMEILVNRVDYTRALIGEAWFNDRILNEYVINRVDRISRMIEDLIQRRVASGAFRPVDPVLTARMILATVVSAILPVMRGIQPPPDAARRRQLAEEIIQVILHGIAVHPPQ